MTHLTVRLFETPTFSRPFGNLQARISSLLIETNEHGFGSLIMTVTMPLLEAFDIYTRSPAGSIRVKGGGMTIFEGRIEDRDLISTGVRIKALGFFGAYLDVVYTGLWTKTGVQGWRKVTGSDHSSYRDQLHGFDNTNRVYINLLLDQIYGQNADRGGQTWAVPHNGDRALTRFTASWQARLPINWDARLIEFDEDFTSGATLFTYAGEGAGTTGSGTIDVNVTKNRLVWELRNDTGGDYTSTAANDLWHGRLSAITAQTFGSVASPVVDAADIVEGMAVFIDSVNSDHASTSPILIQAGGVTLTDESYIDKLPADILANLTRSGEKNSDLFEVGVWEDQILHYRPRGDDGRDFFTDVEAMTISSTLDTLVNSAYATYKEPSGRTLRTAVAVNQNSIDRLDIIRRRHQVTRTTSSSLAETYRDALLERQKDITPKAQIIMRGLFNRSGGRYPLWVLRSGDTLTLRNLPSTAPQELDKIRKFVVKRTRYDAIKDILKPTPELDIPTVEFIIANNSISTDLQNSAQGTVGQGTPDE